MGCPLYAILQKLICNTTIHKHKVPSTLLWNLDHASLDRLLDYLNAQRSQATIPQEWKPAGITVVTNPNNTLKLYNLCPISLKCCLGKLFEHIHNGMSGNLEDDLHFPDTTFYFRAYFITSHNRFTSLSPDIKGAFDNVSHTHLISTNCGTTYTSYVKASLTNRTAMLGLSHLRSPLFLHDHKVRPKDK